MAHMLPVSRFAAACPLACALALPASVLVARQGFPWLQPASPGRSVEESTLATAAGLTLVVLPADAGCSPSHGMERLTHTGGPSGGT